MCFWHTTLFLSLYITVLARRFFCCSLGFRLAITFGIGRGRASNGRRSGRAGNASLQENCRLDSLQYHIALGVGLLLRQLRSILFSYPGSSCGGPGRHSQYVFYSTAGIHSACSQQSNSKRIHIYFINNFIHNSLIFMFKCSSFTDSLLQVYRFGTQTLLEPKRMYPTADETESERPQPQTIDMTPNASANYLSVNTLPPCVQKANWWLAVHNLFPDRLKGELCLKLYQQHFSQKAFMATVNIGKRLLGLRG